MAKRFTDTELWDKEWFMALSPKLKCLVKFVRDKSDLCGVWSPNWKITNAYIGENCTETELLEIDGGHQFYKMTSGKFFCIGFVEFQYGNLSEKSPVHRKILSLLKQNGLEEIYKKIGYQYPINRVQEEEEDKDKEEEEDKEEEKEKDSAAKNKKPLPLTYPFDSLNFKIVWAGWKNHLVEARKPYQTFSSEQAALQFLSDYGEPEAIEIIKTAIRNQWKNLRKPDEQPNNKNQRKTNLGRLNALTNSVLQKPLTYVDGSGGHSQ